VGKIAENTEKLLEQEDDPGRRLEIFCSQHLQAMKKNRYLAEVIQIELRQPYKVIKDYRNNTFSKYSGIIGTIIRQGQRSGCFRSDLHPDIAKRCIFGALDEISRVWNASLESNYAVNEIVNEVLTIFLSGIESKNSCEEDG
jgi:TetR/AcrR family fatty acid metabolism transcriptional regulator